MIHDPVSLTRDRLRDRCLTLTEDHDSRSSGVLLITVRPVSTVELVNSQILLRGKESEGCVLVAAGNTRILNRLHNPVWSNGELFNKKTWVGNVDNLQVMYSSQNNGQPFSCTINETDWAFC